VAAGAATAGDRARIEGFDNCGKVADEGTRSPVKSANVKCKRARSIGSAFIQDDELRSKWRTYNPAGCEFFLFRDGHKGELLDWFESRGPIDFKLIYLVKLRGCES
jgi:hypothetical protein